MKNFRLWPVFLLLPVIGTAFAAADAQPIARVEIVYAAMEPYIDATASELASFKAWAEQRAADFVPPDRKLVITITAIDMAGRFEWWHGPQFANVRIVRDVYPPRMDLQFKLIDANGAVAGEGKRDLHSPGLPFAHLNGDDPLRFEKTLFNDWLRSEFPKS